MKKQPVNPYLPSWEYIPDGEPYVFGKRLYIFGSHEPYHGDDFCLLNYVGWSAPIDDLSDWQYEGTIYDRKKDPHYKPGNRLFAPDVQQGADGRYYLYYSFDQTGIISVAVCDRPAGNYEYYGDIHYPDGTILGKKEGDLFQYDPGVLVDDDGSVWLYSGFCFNGVKTPKLAHLPANHQGAMAIRLEQDMITVKEAPVFIVPSEFNSAGTGFEGHAFFEASSIRKIGSRYYFIYSSENGHELCYAASNTPEGGFTYGGTIVSNGDIGYSGRREALNYTGTNHGSIVNIGDDWYVFYHRQTGGSAYSRQGCAEKIHIAADGSIAQVPITSQGLNGKPLSADPGTAYPAGIAFGLLSAEGALPYRPKWHVDDNHPWIGQDIPDVEPEEAAAIIQAGNTGSLLQYVHNLRDGARAGYRYFDLRGLSSIYITYSCADETEGMLAVWIGRNGNLVNGIFAGMISSSQFSDDTSSGTVSGTVSGTISEDTPDPVRRTAELQIPFSQLQIDDPGQVEFWILYAGTGSCNIHSFRFS